MHVKVMARKPNFSHLEIETLIEEFQNHKEKLNTSFTGTSTNASKQTAWASVASKVSLVSGVTRTPKDIKKKWRNMSGDSKKKLLKVRKEATKTAGRSSTPVKLSATDIRVLETIGQTATKGIPGGINRAAPSSSNTSSLPETFESNSYQRENAMKSTSTTASRKQKRSSGHDEGQDIVEIERQRLEVEKKRLEVEEKRLDLEQRKHDLDEKKYSRGFMVCDSQKEEDSDPDSFIL